MTKRQAALVFGGLTVVIIGYVAWCSRSFYLMVALPDLGFIPKEERSSILRELEDSDLRSPTKFSFRLLTHFCTRPYDSSPETVKVSYTESKHGASASATRSMRHLRPDLTSFPSGYTIPMELLEKVDGDWRRVPKLEEGSY